VRLRRVVAVDFAHHQLHEQTLEPDRTPEIEQYSWLVSVTRCSSVIESYSGVPDSVDHSSDRP
jgi:hypothetical protein